MVHGGGAGGVRHVALLYHRIDDPVVGSFKALSYTAAEEGQGIAQHRPADRHPIEGGHSGEAVGTGGEAAQEVAQQLLVVVLTQNVEHEAIAHLHQGLDRPVLGHRHREPRRLEAGLAHPARHHGAAAQGFPFPLPRRNHIQSAGKPAQGLVEVAIEALHCRDRLLAGEQLAQVGAGLLAALVILGRGHLADPQRLEGLLLAQTPQLGGHGVDRFVVAAVGVVAGHPLAALQGRQQGADRGLQLRIGLGRPGGHHHGAGFPHQGGQLLGIGGAQIHQLHLGFGLADAAGDRLADAVAEAVLAQVTDRRIGLPLAAAGAPVAVVAQPEIKVVAQQRAVAHGDRVECRQRVHALHRLQHAAGVGAHQAVVVEAEIGGDGARIAVEQLLRAVMQAEGIAGVEDAGAVVEGEDRVGPMEVGGTEELEAVRHAAAGVGAQIQLLAALDGAGAEGAVHLVFQELDRHL